MLAPVGLPTKSILDTSTTLRLDGHKGVIEPALANGKRVYCLKSELTANPTYHGSFAFAKLAFEHLVYLAGPKNA